MGCSVGRFLARIRRPIEWAQDHELLGRDIRIELGLNEALSDYRAYSIMPYCLSVRAVSFAAFQRP
jgi:hypothetical protein